MESDWLSGSRNEVSLMPAVPFRLHFADPLSLGPGGGCWRLIPHQLGEMETGVCGGREGAGSLQAEPRKDTSPAIPGEK